MPFPTARRGRSRRIPKIPRFAVEQKSEPEPRDHAECNARHRLAFLGELLAKIGRAGRIGVVMSV